LDLRSSSDFRDGHIDGARWAIRPRLKELKIRADQEVILMTPDAAPAELAALDLREAGISNLSLCREGSESWRAAGLEIIKTPDFPADKDCIDHLFFVYDRHGGNLEAARQYLAWETNLLKQMDEQEHAAFRIAK